MKYIAVFEIPNDKVGLLELTLPTSDGLTVTSPIEFKKAPKPMEISLHGEFGYKDTQTTKYIKEGYNSALRDCGVLEK